MLLSRPGRWMCLVTFFDGRRYRVGGLISSIPNERTICMAMASQACK